MQDKGWSVDWSYPRATTQLLSKTLNLSGPKLTVDGYQLALQQHGKFSTASAADRAFRTLLGLKAQDLQQQQNPPALASLRVVFANPAPRPVAPEPPIPLPSTTQQQRGRQQQGMSQPPPMAPQALPGRTPQQQQQQQRGRQQHSAIAAGHAQGGYGVIQGGQVMDMMGGLIQSMGMVQQQQQQRQLWEQQQQGSYNAVVGGWSQHGWSQQQPMQQQALQWQPWQEQLQQQQELGSNVAGGWRQQQQWQQQPWQAMQQQQPQQQEFPMNVAGGGSHQAMQEWPWRQ